MSEAYLHRYCAEFDFRYDGRGFSDSDRTVEAVKGARGKRLMYRNLLHPLPNVYEPPRQIGEQRKRPFR
jgi:hypothetical protein